MEMTAYACPSQDMSIKLFAGILSTLARRVRVVWGMSMHATKDRTPRVTPLDETTTRWSDWRWQLRHRCRNLRQLERFLELSPPERQALEQTREILPVAITPYYLSLMHPGDPQDPLRRTLVPVMGEFATLPGDSPDPLDEARDTVVPGVIRRHPDRVVLLATGVCATYCRYCTRSRLVGGGEKLTGHWDQAIAYIADHPEIRDVLISGGDPLLLSTSRLDGLLTRLRAIPHVELLRIGSRIPLVLPMRITRKLVDMLRKHHPLAVSLHAIHPRELTPLAQTALARLADAGIMLAGQTVLLAGINDSLPVLADLMRGLLRNRVRPYYLYQCDPIPGSGHFRVPVEQGLRLMAGLQGHMSGYAVPRFVIDAPGGGGKIPLASETVVGRDARGWLLKNHLGEIFCYPEAFVE
ncbi:MAG: KamA family radical SAM protein [Magnetococcales bacterium]|nr:KamA family radical SAM protein [Magnetococcales bacterium]